METETRSLKCNLTEEEKSKLLQDAARMTVEDKSAAQQNIDTAAARLKSAKSCAEAMQSSIDAKLDVANRGWESRQVECHWRPDRAAGVKRLFRSDTLEVVETRDMPRQQTIDAVVSSEPKPAISPELEGVEVGLHGEDEDGRHFKVDAIAPDSVVLLFADGETKRVMAADWPDYEPDADIDQQEYIDGYEAEKPSEETTIEKSEDGQKLLKALDHEGKTREELVAETGLPTTMVKGGLGLFVERGFATEGKRDTGKAGRKPVTYAITDEGAEQIMPDEG